MPSPLVGRGSGTPGPPDAAWYRTAVDRAAYGSYGSPSKRTDFSAFSPDTRDGLGSPARLARPPPSYAPENAPSDVANSPYSRPRPKGLEDVALAARREDGALAPRRGSLGRFAADEGGRRGSLSRAAAGDDARRSPGGEWGDDAARWGSLGRGAPGDARRPPPYGKAAAESDDVSELWDPAKGVDEDSSPVHISASQVRELVELIVKLEQRHERLQERNAALTSRVMRLRENYKTAARMSGDAKAVKHRAFNAWHALVTDFRLGSSIEKQAHALAECRKVTEQLGVGLVQERDRREAVERAADAKKAELQKVLGACLQTEAAIAQRQARMANLQRRLAEAEEVIEQSRLDSRQVADNLAAYDARKREVERLQRPVVVGSPQLRQPGPGMAPMLPQACRPMALDQHGRLVQVPMDRFGAMSEGAASPGGGGAASPPAVVVLSPSRSAQALLAQPRVASKTVTMAPSVLGHGATGAARARSPLSGGSEWSSQASRPGACAGATAPGQQPVAVYPAYAKAPQGVTTVYPGSPVLVGRSLSPMPRAPSTLSQAGQGPAAGSVAASTDAQSLKSSVSATCVGGPSAYLCGTMG